MDMDIAYTQTDRQTDRSTDRQTEIWIMGKTEKQIVDRQMDRPRDRPVDRQMDRNMSVYLHTIGVCAAYQLRGPPAGSPGVDQGPGCWGAGAGCRLSDPTLPKWVFP